MFIAVTFIIIILGVLVAGAWFAWHATPGPRSKKALAAGLTSAVMLTLGIVFIEYIALAIMISAIGVSALGVATGRLPFWKGLAAGFGAPIVAYGGLIVVRLLHGIAFPDNGEHCWFNAVDGIIGSDVFGVEAPLLLIGLGIALLAAAFVAGRDARGWLVFIGAALVLGFGIVELHRYWNLISARLAAPPTWVCFDRESRADPALLVSHRSRSTSPCRTVSFVNTFLPEVQVMNAKRICPACGETVPTNDASRCEACGYSFIGSSIGGRTISPATSVQESIRQSISERARQEGGLVVRPAETLHGGVSLAFATDTSGSMVDDQKIESASEALLDTVNGFPAEVVNQIGAAVITFSERARVRDSMDSLHVIRRSFRPLTQSDCGGGTNIADGLKIAGEQVNIARRNAERGKIYKVVCLLSDGCSNHGGDPVKVARKLKADRLLRIVCVGFGADMDRSVLQAIASPGLFFEAHTGSALRDLYASFQQAVTSSIVEGRDPGDCLSSVA